MSSMTNESPACTPPCSTNNSKEPPPCASVYAKPGNCCQTPVPITQLRLSATNTPAADHSRNAKQTCRPGESLRTQPEAPYCVPATVPVTGRGDVVTAKPGVPASAATRNAPASNRPLSSRDGAAWYACQPNELSTSEPFRTRFGAAGGSVTTNIMSSNTNESPPNAPPCSTNNSNEPPPTAEYTNPGNCCHSPVPMRQLRSTPSTASAGDHSCSAKQITRPPVS